jgi:hypothetical protein
LKASLEKYLKRGGTKTAIAKGMGKTLQAFNRFLEFRPNEEFEVHFNPVSPNHVWKFVIKARKHPEVIVFDKMREES